MGHPKIVLTADRTLMSPYRNLSLATFFGCAPAIDPHRDPKSIWHRVLGKQVTPKVLFDFICNYIPHTDGVADYAPYGLRKVEAGLLRDGFERKDVVVAPPRPHRAVHRPRDRGRGHVRDGSARHGPSHDDVHVRPQADLVRRVLQPRAAHEESTRPRQGAAARQGSLQARRAPGSTTMRQKRYPSTACTPSWRASWAASPPRSMGTPAGSSTT